MVAAPFAFVTAVVEARGLIVTSVGDHACRVEPQSTELPWFCDLDDGTPTGENNPASFVRWVCPPLRLRPTASGRGGGPGLEGGRGGSGTGGAPVRPPVRPRPAGQAARSARRSCGHSPGRG